MVATVKLILLIYFVFYSIIIVIAMAVFIYRYKTDKSITKKSNRLLSISDKKYFYKATEYKHELFTTDYNLAVSFIGKKSGIIIKTEFDRLYKDGEELEYEKIVKGKVKFSTMSKLKNQSK